MFVVFLPSGFGSRTDWMCTEMAFNACKWVDSTFIVLQYLVALFACEVAPLNDVPRLLECFLRPWPGTYSLRKILVSPKGEVKVGAAIQRQCLCSIRLERLWNIRSSQSHIGACVCTKDLFTRRKGHPTSRVTLLYCSSSFSLHVG